MKRKILVAFIAAMPICISTPATAGSECAAETKGPGLIEVNLVDQDDGEQVGTLEVSNTSEVMKFVLQIDDKINTKEIQLWIGEQISDVPDHKGKPNFGKFPYKIDDFEFDKRSNTYTLIQNLKDDLHFYWQGKGHRWDFMVHGEYAGGGFNAKGGGIPGASQSCVSSNDRG